MARKFDIAANDSLAHALTTGAWESVAAEPVQLPASAFQAPVNDMDTAALLEGITRTSQDIWQRAA